jgi:putative toxin-antitoxin system antitoxin component (TIGR02293 family)
MQAAVDKVYRQLGGKAGTGMLIKSEGQMESLLRAGIPVTALNSLRDKWGFTIAELAEALDIAKSTLMRKQEQRGSLSSADSDRLYRLASILSLAEEYIGDLAKARHWIRQPNLVLGGVTPLKALETEIGAQRVTQVLGRIAYGGVS